MADNNPNPAKDRHIFYCVCNWRFKNPTCSEIQQFLTEKQDVRAGYKVLNLSRGGAKMERWRTEVFRNLNTHEDAIQKLVKVPVAKHHWTAKQCQRFSRAMPSTPVDWKTYSREAHNPVRSDGNLHVSGKSANGYNEVRKYLNVPNVPYAVLAEEYNNQQDHLKYKARTEHREMAARQKHFKELSYKNYIGMLERMAFLEKSLEQKKAAVKSFKRKIKDFESTTELLKKKLNIKSQF